MSNQLDGATWRKSSRSSGSGGNCVEVATAASVVGIRDSKNDPATGPVLQLDRSEFAAFLDSVKAGNFDLS